MRSVNANLLEINQAKKEGKTNVDLNAPTTSDNTPGGSTPGCSSTGQTGSEGQGSESTGGTTGKDDTGDSPSPKDRLARVLAPSPAYPPPPKKSTFNTQHSKKMKANTWKTILQIAISILTAIATTLGVTSCMG